ncbi:MAG: polyprenyl synthetase family protein [Euryarchaeota archaeon]|nr:polyprenyl synthetase family protein [Euryarchaeota archaeon]
MGKGLDLRAISGEMRQVEDLMMQSIGSGGSPLREVSLHVLSAGGKRIRPAMGIAAYFVAGGDDPSRVIPMAAAVEMIHTATLLHDDIMDQSDLRRGRPAAHRKFGVKAALVTGDFLFSQAFGLCSGYGPEVIGVTAAACRELAGAEMLQATPWRELTEELCIQIDGRKTGALMGAGMEAGALVVGARPGERESLRRFGHSVGTAFQIIDDCLDFSLDGSTGKPTGGDILGGKATLPVVHALSRASDADRRLLEDFLCYPAGSDRLREVVGALARTGSLDYARGRAAAFSAAARKELRPLKGSPHRTLLEDITYYVLDRTS